MHLPMLEREVNTALRTSSARPLIRLLKDQQQGFT